MKALRWGLLAVALLTALLAALIWGAGSAGGLAWLGRRLADAQIEGAEGSLWGGLRAERFVLNLPGLRVEAEGIDWQPQAVGPRRVEGALALRRLRLTPQGPSGTPLTEAKLRESLRLPLALRLAPLKVERFEWGTQLALQALALKEAGLEDGRLQLQALRLQWPRADGVLNLSGDARLDAQLQLKLRAEMATLRASLDAQGPLSALPLRLQISQGEAGRLEAEGELAPLSAQPLRRLQGRLSQLNPQGLHPSLPEGLWEGQLRLQPQAGLLQLQVDASNARALRLDEGGWPLRRLQLEAGLDAADWTRSQLRQLDAELGNRRAAAGSLRLALQALPRAGAAFAAQLRAESVRLSGLHGGWPALQLGGELRAQQARLGEGPLQLQAQLRALPLPGLPAALGQGWRLQGEAAVQDGRLALQELLVRELGDTPSRLRASGSLRWAPQLAAEFELESQAWRTPLPPWPTPSLLQGRAQLKLAQSRERIDAALKLQLQEGTRLADLPLQGEAEWTAGAQWQLKLSEGREAPNRFELQGSQPPLRAWRELARAEAWVPERAQWQLPRLARLQALAAPWVTGLQGASEGEWTTASGRLRVQKLQVERLQLEQLQAELRADETLDLQLKGLQAPGLLLKEASLGGSLAGELRLRALADVAALREQRNPPRSLLLEAQSSAPRRAGEAWLLGPLQLRLAEQGGAEWLQLAEAQLRWQQRTLSLSAPALRAAGETLQLQEARASWAGVRPEFALRLQGRPRLAPWLRLAQPEADWDGDLRAGFSLALQRRESLALQLDLQREAGDLLLGKQALGLQQLQLNVSQDAQRESRLLALLEGSRLGRALLRAETDAGGQALRGEAKLDLPALEALQPWLRAAAPGLLLAGSAQAELRLTGSLAAPRAQGTASAQLTRALHAPSGVGLGEARLRLQLQEQGLRIEELQAQGLGKDGGSLVGEGELRWKDLGADQLDRLQGSLSLRAERLRLLQRFDRRLVASGQLRAELQPRLLRVRGALSADEGVFEIGRSDAPTLDDDVRVLREPQAGEGPPPRRGTPAVPRLQRDVDVSVDLGQRLRIAGRGLSSRLTGQLRFVEQGGRPLQSTGLIELNGGRYRAYGQNLDIETGLLRFTGRLDNPRLDILAIRPNLETRVGVQVTGTAENPRVRLYSEPEMADADKLAWLLLGRAPDELGRADTAILQRAALALLAGEGTNPAAELMDKLGLTELSLSQSDDAGTTLRLGAQLGKRWSLGYERSLDAATGSWQLVYRLGQRFRLRAQSGEESAVDLLWLWRFD